MQPSILLVIIVITSIAISVSILTSYIATITSFFLSRSWLYTEKSILSTSPSSLLLGPTGGSEIKGVRGDVTAIQIYRSTITPEVKDYYDILSVSVMKINNKLTFTMDLAGDSNKNQTKMKNMKRHIFGCYITMLPVFQPQTTNKSTH
ncbi:MAG: hypothetical protein ACJ72S_11140 [Nitrososphaeraceae archaeon]